LRVKGFKEFRGFWRGREFKGFWRAFGERGERGERT